MPRIQYQKIRFSQVKLELIAKAVSIIQKYRADGFDLTVRQIYYQFVARDWFLDDQRYILVDKKWVRDPKGTKNAEPNYQYLICLLSDARMAGLIDWEAIVDRTREMGGNSHWTNPEHIIGIVADQYRIDTWLKQPRRPEVWVEKDALEGVVSVICKRLDIPYFSCRGYTSMSSIWQNAQRLREIVDKKKAVPVVLHIGDFDPSGVDMSRDVEDRLRMFMGRAAGERLVFKRIALSREQIDAFNPPPNPVKLGDSRSKKFRDEHGDECWELDALDPNTIDQIITDEVAEHRIDDLHDKYVARQDKEKLLLKGVKDNWKDIVARLESGNGDSNSKGK